MKTTNEIAQEAAIEIDAMGYEIEHLIYIGKLANTITKAIEAGRVQGEPVGQVLTADQFLRTTLKSNVVWFTEPEPGVNIYTSPPKRHPLGDQQIINLMPARISAQHDGDLMLFARAIEAAINGGEG